MIGTRNNQTVEYIYTKDPALDLTNENLNFTKFIESFDRKYWPTKEGKTPTVFKLRKLTREQYQAVSTMDASQRAAAAVSCALVEVTNFKDAAGNDVILEKTDDGKRLTANCLNQLFSPDLFAELLQIITVLTELNPLADAR